MGLADFLILAAVAVLAVLAAVHAARRRGRACGGECSSCPYHTQCRKPKKK